MIVKETINYIYANGTRKEKTAVSPYGKAVIYTGTKDLVTDHASWQPGLGLDAVESPKTKNKNYTLADKAEVLVIKLDINNDGKITAESNDPLTYTVHYYVPEYAQVIFYSGATGQSLANYLVQHSQKASLTDIYSELGNNSGKQPTSFVDANTIVNFLKNNHYIFIGAFGDGSITNSDYPRISYGNFNSDETRNQNSVLHLKHVLDNQTEVATVIEKASYVYENGPQADRIVADVATSPTGQGITCTRTRTVDLVNDPKGKNTKWSNRVSNKTSIENFNLPERANGPDTQEKIYSLDLAQIRAAKNGKESDYSTLKLPFGALGLSNDKTINLSVTIPYTLAENITVNYTDDTTGKTLESKSLPGKPNTKANCSTKATVDEYVAQNYALVNDPTNQKSLSFDNDELPNNQSYGVHLKHGIAPPSNQGMITEAIRYIYEDGFPAANDATNQLASTGTDTRGLVIGAADTKWPDPQTFASVTSPTISSYIPDQLKIDTIQADHDSKDIEKTVIYRAEKRSAVLRFYDDIEGKSIDFVKGLETDGINKATTSFIIPSNYGFSNYNFVAADVNNDPKDTATKLSGNTLSTVTYGKFDINDQADQYFIAHFTHKTTNTKGNKSASGKVALYAKNSSKKGQAFEAIGLGNTTFTRNDQKDLIIDQVSWENWAIADNSHTVPLPVTLSTVYKINPTSITQTTPVSRKFEVNSQTVSPLAFNVATGQDLIRSLTDNTGFMVKVSYALAENVSITYIDDITDKTLEAKSLSGEPNTNSQYFGLVNTQPRITL